MDTARKTLLVVEDENGIREAVLMLLADMGYNVLSAADGKEAIQLIQKNTIDLVMTDVFMPDCDGIELMTYIRKNNPKLKTVVVSGGDPQFLKVSEYLGANKILRKPYGRQELWNVLNELLG